MLRFSVLFMVLLILVESHAQDFPYGKVMNNELFLKIYDKDTSAVAVVLNEYGEAYFEDGGNYNLIFEHHVKIKILKKSGLRFADLEIEIRKNESKTESLRSFKASSFSFVNGSIKETKISEKNVFTENRYEYLDVKKIAIPEVTVGTVIEFQYTLESPFIFKFRGWEFQSDIPKIRSEFRAVIPGNYIYNTTLRGFYELSTNESELVRNCFSPGGQSTDCARSIYVMENIPSFVEEDYMTAKSNYLSAINFELSQVTYSDGRIDKITKEWKDAEQELRIHSDFGIQLRRGANILEEEVKKIIVGESDELIKARKIYGFIKNWYHFDEEYTKYSKSGIKKAFDRKVGNVGDINLSLIVALRYAGLDVEPVILSTRANGLPIELHPVISDFNYVVAKVNIGGKIYLADATEDFYPFGLLPERCLNGKGRVLGEKESSWIELKPVDRAKKINMLTLKLDSDGVMRGTMETSFFGYEAVNQRKKIHSFSSAKEYFDNLQNTLDGTQIIKFELKNQDELEKPLVQKLTVEISVFEKEHVRDFLFNPFIPAKWDKNPFTSEQRLYPVDFGTPQEFITILNLEYPEEFEIANSVEKQGLALPNNGGRFILTFQNSNNKVSINNSLLLSKAVFTSAEYHYLKELFNQIIQTQNTDLIFKRRVK